MVNLSDLLIFSGQWLNSVGCVGYYEDCCANLDGIDGVNLADFSLFAETWGHAESFPVVINEIHYNPDLSEELVEFVELCNLSSKSIDLSGWELTGGIRYIFPSGTRIDAGGYLVIAEDPTPAYVDVTIPGKYGTPTGLVLGPFAGKLSNNGETVTLTDAWGRIVDKVDYKLGFPWPMVGDAVSEPGTGASIQLVNPTFDNDLGGNWRSAYPTPGAANVGVYMANNPPCIRQVKHHPKQPRANDVVTITAKVTDPDGVSAVILRYQVIEPGSYIPITLPNLSTTVPTVPNPEYENPVNWTAVPMSDNGLNGDVSAGDRVYTVCVPAEIQTHRCLIRYRITAIDNGGRSVTVPYADDSQPNFAYFVYNGVPSWTGDGVTYSSEVLTSLPVYHLIARNSDVENCFWNSSWDDGEYHFAGTLVYDGEVYDHIYYHIRGQYSTFRWGKNKCRFRFNRGHYFQAKDDYGNKYENKWKYLILGTGTCPWWQWPHPGSWDQGTGGMVLNEPLSYRLYNLAGVPAPYTHFFHFRVIDAVSETGPTQYDGDFWGLFFAVEEPDGRFLDEHGLADGNVYKMEVGTPDQKNQGPTQVTDDSDVWDFINGQNTSSTQSWWEQNTRLDWYYSFKTVGIVINNSDPRPQENCFYFHDPLTGKWSIHPWDLDLTYEWATHYTWWENITYCLNYPVLNLAYQNRARELVDLLFDNDHCGWRQTDQLVDELASVIATPYNGQRFVDAERALWDNHPKVNSFYRNLWYEHNEFFTQPGRAKNWDNMVAYYKQFLTAEGMSGFLSGSYGLHELLPSIADLAIPNKPTISYIGQPGYPVNNLLFQTTAFSDPQGDDTFAALKWRIAEVEPYSPAELSEPGQPQTFELISRNEIWKYYRAVNGEPSEPVTEWRLLYYDDSNWQSGQTSIGYGDNDDLTDLALQSPPMQNNYTSIYLRKIFEVSNLDDIESFALRVYVDGGCVVWINGVEVARLNCSNGFKAWNATTGAAYIEPAWYDIMLPAPYNYFIEGENVIAVHVLNESIDSSDLSFDAILTGESSNSVYFQKTKRGKYEIQTLWESSEITNSTETIIQIPASGLQVGKHYRVRCRMKDNTGRWSHWSDPIQFTAGESLSVGTLEHLRITEVMYNPAPADPARGDLNVDKDEFEFVELKNCSVDETLDLTYVELASGVTFRFADGVVSSLAPGEFVLVVRNIAAFSSRYPGSSGRIAGAYSGKLDNSGEQITLVDIINGTIADFKYNDGYGWPVSADGAGHSLVPLDSAIPKETTGSLNYGGNWRASTYRHGSPGADDPVPLAGIVINELMAHTDFRDPVYPQYDSNDWVELYNPTSSTMVLDGNWYLSDSLDDLRKWALPAGTIPVGDWISFDEITGFHNPISTGFGLDKTGEYVLLSYLPGTSADRVVDCVRFSGQPNNISFGRYPDGGTYWFFLATPGSRNAANAAPLPKGVLISEIMYHPKEGTNNEEYIELYNTTTSSVSLFNTAGTWRIANAVSYTFPAGVSIPGDGRIVVVGFDPAVENARLTAFNTAYGSALTAGITIFGPWVGDLSNSGERIVLQEPQEADPPQILSIWWIDIDQVIYSNQDPWPASLDGTGTALHRISLGPDDSGDAPNNWQADAPSPGR